MLLFNETVNLYKHYVFILFVLLFLLLDGPTEDQLLIVHLGSKIISWNVCGMFLVSDSVQFFLHLLFGNRVITLFT